MPNRRCRCVDMLTFCTFLRLAVGVPCEDTAVKGKRRRLAVAVGAPVRIYVGAVAFGATWSALK